MSEAFAAADVKEWGDLCVAFNTRCCEVQRPPLSVVTGDSFWTMFVSAMEVMRVASAMQLQLDVDFDFGVQVSPQSVALVAVNAAADDVSDRAAAEVTKAAASAASGAAESRFNAAAASHQASLAIMQRVLSARSASERAAAVLQLPCLVSQTSGAAAAADCDSIIAAAAASVLTLSYSFNPPSPHPLHPLITATGIITSAASRVGLDVAIIELLPCLSQTMQPSTTFHKLARAHAPNVQPSASLALVAAAAASAARYSGSVAVAVGSMMITPQPLSAVEMAAVICGEVERQLGNKLSRDNDSSTLRFLPSGGASAVT